MVAAAAALRPRRFRRQPAGAGRLSRRWSTSAGAASWARSSRSTSTSARSRSPATWPASRFPQGMDWDMWLGPAPWAPYHPYRCSGSFDINGTQLAVVQRLFRRRHDRLGRAPLRRRDLRRRRPRAGARGSHLSRRQGKASTSPTAIPTACSCTTTIPGMGNLQVVGTPGEKRAAKPVPTYKGKGGIYGDFIDCVQDPREALPRHRAGHAHHRPSATWASSPTS